MPRTLIDKKNEEKPCSALYNLIAAHCYGLNQDEAGRLFDVTRATFCNRMKNPENFKIGELLNFCRNAHVPIDELREAIKLNER